MGRRAEGWKLHPKRGILYVYFTHQGTRYKVSTGHRDLEGARREASAIFLRTLGGRARTTRRAASTALIDLFGDWLADWEADHDAETVRTYKQYSNRWLTYFGSLARLTDRTLADFARERLRRVQRTSVRKELSALRGFLRWCVEQEHLDELPRIQELPKRAIGVVAHERKAPPDLTPEQIAAILEQLPEHGRWQTRPRARFTVAWETGLRPETISLIRAPEHYRRGALELVVPASSDKARAGRTLPLTAAARAALDSVCPDVGLLFGPKRLRGFLRRAATAAGLPAEVVEALTPYALRHARALALVEAKASLPGIMYLMGHSNVATTNRYLKPRRRQADDALALMEKQSRSGSKP